MGNIGRDLSKQILCPICNKRVWAKLFAAHLQKHGKDGK